MRYPDSVTRRVAPGGLKASFRSGMRTRMLGERTWGPVGRLWAGSLVLCLGLATALPAQDPPPESPCLDDLPFVEALPIEMSLPALDVVSDGCESFESPTVSFMVGQEGQTYYFAIEQSSGCVEADDKLRQWVACWTFEAALCGGESAPSVVETTIEWTGGESETEAPCDRADNEPPGEGEG